VHTLGIFDSQEGGLARNKRFSLYLAAFGLLGLAVLLRAADFDQGDSISGVYLGAAILSLLSGIMALAVSREPQQAPVSQIGPGVGVNQPTSSRDALLEFSLWRSERTKHISPAGLRDISTALADDSSVEELGDVKTTPQATKPSNQQQYESSRDPWSRILSDFASRRPRSRSKRRGK
jgi:hypothetical protein